MKGAIMSSKRRVYRQSFADAERLVVPNQSLSLKQILQRFVRREQLPILREGVYEERFGDLEKMARMDMVDRAEIADDLREKIAGFERREKEREEKEKATKAKADADAMEAEIQKRVKEQTAPKVAGA